MSPIELWKLRTQMGMTQREFADIIGRTVTSISAYEGGNKTIPRVVELAALYLLEQHRRKTRVLTQYRRKALQKRARWVRNRQSTHIINQRKKEEANNDDSTSGVRKDIPEGVQGMD